MGGGSSKSSKKKVSDMPAVAQQKAQQGQTRPNNNLVETFGSVNQTKEDQPEIMSVSKTVVVVEDVSNSKQISGEQVNLTSYTQDSSESEKSMELNLNVEKDELNLLSDSIETIDSNSSIEQTPSEAVAENSGAKNSQKRFALTPRGAYSKIVLI